MENFDWLGWVVFVTLVAMSFLSWYFIIANGIRNATVKARADKVIDGFWGNGSTQDAIRELEAQPKSEPFSKIALKARSEAHTSELQSLMRSSYAAFCLKQKKSKKQIHNHILI